MSATFNGSGNGHGTKTLLRQIKKTMPQIAEPASSIKESSVVFITADGVKLHGAVVRITQHIAVFELYSPSVTPRFSEVLSNFEIIMQARKIYTGRAIVRNILDARMKIVCEVTLAESGWMDLNLAEILQQDDQPLKAFKNFLNDWQKLYKVSSGFKIIISDMQTFLHDLRLWLEQVELGIQSLSADKQLKFEQQTMKQIGELLVPTFDMLHEKLESISKNISEDLRPAHQAFAQRQLHPLLLCSPFASRAYRKPLGYAGDYEMVNMIALNPYQGSSLYAKVMNLWFLSQWPSKAHRNRLTYLEECLKNEALRAARANNKARIFNFACGPAIEIQNFLTESAFSEHVEFTLADFNEETLKFLGQTIDFIKKKFGLQTSFTYQKKNIHQLIKESGKAKGAGRLEYDFIYCAGLFDYLPDSTCRRLMEIFYDWLAPDGLLVVTNVVDEKPFRHMLEFILDWHLIYRDTKTSASLIPDSVPKDAWRVKNDVTGVNLFVEVRKPRDV